MSELHHFRERETLKKEEEKKNQERNINVAAKSTDRLR